MTPAPGGGVLNRRFRRFWRILRFLQNRLIGFPFIRGFPFHEWNETHTLMMNASQVYECVEVSPSEKLVLKYATLGFPFIRGFHSHEWNETNPLTMTASQVYECVKVSLSELWVLKYATLGSPFIRGFPSHEWNDTHPWWWLLAKCTRVQKIRFLKS